MIKINLLGDETVVDTSGKKFIAGFLVSLVMLLGLFYVVRSSMSAEIERLTLDIETKERSLKDLEKVTAEVRDLEAKEAEYNNKIVVIANLKRSKIGPVRVLDDLNRSIPERSWLTQIKEDGGMMRIDGRAIDNQTIAAFMKDLDVSNYYHAVQLVETRQVDDRGVKVKAFSLATEVRYNGSAPAVPATDKKG